jgi:hypothetical protein
MYQKACLFLDHSPSANRSASSSKNLSNKGAYAICLPLFTTCTRIAARWCSGSLFLVVCRDLKVLAEVDELSVQEQVTDEGARLFRENPYKKAFGSFQCC